MDNQFEPLATGEVLSVDESALFLIGHRTFRVGEISEAIRMQLEYGISGWSQDKDGWFSEAGIPCEVLRFSSNGWQKGKVRINLEFCPIDSADESQVTSASSEPVATAPSSAGVADQFNFIDDEDEDLSLDSTAFDEAIPLGAGSVVADEFALDEPADDELEDEFDLGTPADDTVLEDEFDLGTPAADALEDEFDLGTSADDIALEDEFDLGTPIDTAIEQELEAPSAVYVEVEQEVFIASSDNELLTDQASTSLDDDFDLGEISDSIEQELELVESPTSNNDELIDLSEMSAESDDDLDFGSMSAGGEDDLDFGGMSAGSEDDLDFGDLSASGEDEFQFGEMSLNKELEENDTDSLLDDVWQDMNEVNWQNNQI